MEELKKHNEWAPKRIQVDNGSEATSKGSNKWVIEKSTTLNYSRPGKLTDNTFMETFNNSF